MKKSVLITGAGSGIGKATAIKLASKGYTIIVVGRTESTLNETLESLPNKGHRIICADVGDKEAWSNALKSNLSMADNLVAVFANAGIGGANIYGENDQWEHIIQTNVSGPYYTIMECLPFLEASESEYKHILVTGSCLSRFAVPNHTAYITAKTAVNGLVKALAIDLSSRKILVNAILPGWVETDMAKDSIQAIADATKRPYKEVFDEQMGFVPLGKMSQPEEIANLVSFMFSADQTSMTGQSIDINNGSFMI